MIESAAATESGHPNIPSQFQPFAEATGSSVSSDDIEPWARFREVEDRSYRLRTLVQTWEHQQREERKLRRDYASRLLWIWVVQALVVNLAFVLIGLRILVVDQWVANAFILSVFVELVGMVLIVMRYLFPKDGDSLLKLIERL
jgi:hypothetical protein